MMPSTTLQLQDIDLSALDLGDAASAYAWPADRRRSRTRGRHRGVDATASAVELMQRLPGPTETAHALMNGSFAMGDLLPALVALAGKPVDSVTVFTLGWNTATTATLAAMVRDGKIRKCRVIASHYFRGSDRQEFDRGDLELTNAGVAVTWARSHVKALLASIGSRRFTAHGSANFRSCANLENLCITGAPAVHRMFQRLADDIFSNPKGYQ